MPAYAPRRLAQASPATTAETIIYTVAGGLVAIVKQIMIANIAADSAVVGVSIVPSGGVAGASNRVVPDVTLGTKSVLVFDLTQVLHTGDFISVKLGAGSTVTVTVSGVETAASALPVSGLQFALEGVIAATRPRVNFHEGANIDLTVTDDPGAGEVDVTVAVAGNLGHTIKDEGTPLTTRAGLNFIGDSVVAIDDAANNETDVGIFHLATAAHSVDQPAQAHALVGAKHTASGLVAGQVVTALTATTFGWVTPPPTKNYATRSYARSTFR